MAKNRVLDEARYVKLPVPAETVSGDPVAVGAIPGVAVNDRDDDGNAVCQRDGEYTLAVKGENSEGEKAVAVGDIVFIDSEGNLSIDSGGTRFGYAGAAVVKNKTEDIPVLIGY